MQKPLSENNKDYVKLQVSHPCSGLVPACQAVSPSPTQPRSQNMESMMARIKARPGGVWVYGRFFWRHPCKAQAWQCMSDDQDGHLSLEACHGRKVRTDERTTARQGHAQRRGGGGGAVRAHVPCFSMNLSACGSRFFPVLFPVALPAFGASFCGVGVHSVQCAVVRIGRWRVSRGSCWRFGCEVVWLEGSEEESVSTGL